jgi:ATP-dependent helicase/nuclease subunit B
MAHRIYTGSFDALEKRLFASIEEQQAADPLAPVIVLVGSNLLALYLKGRIAGHRPVANLRLFTFADLVAKLAGAASSLGGKPRLPRLGASVLLEEILETGTPEVFAKVGGFAGFRGALLDTFRDLRDAGIAPERLEKALPEFKGVTSDRMVHLRALARVYRRFRAGTSCFQDAAEDFRHACIGASAARRILGVDSLFVYGLYDVTGIQAELLVALKKHLDFCYFIPYVDDAVTRFAAPFLHARAMELEATPVVLEENVEGPGLGVFSRRVFALPDIDAEESPLPLPDDGSLALVSVPGESRTAVEIVREILRAVREGVIRGYFEAAVILRQPEEEAPVLAEALRLRGVPYFLHGGSAFSERPFARAILAIADLEVESFSRRAILNAMELIAAALPGATGSKWDVPQWRALVNEPRFLAGVDSWESGTEALLREARDHARRAQARVRLGMEDEEENGHTDSVSQAQRRWDAARALRGGWSALRQAAAGWPAAGSWQRWSDLLRERLAPLLDRALDWNPFLSAVTNLEGLGGLPRESGTDRPVTRARCLAVLKEALAELSFPEGRFQRSGVNLISVSAARGLRFPLVIVPGLTEGRFPAKLRQDPLLLDAERAQIGRPPLLPFKSLRGEEEKLLFYLAIRSAEKRLVLMTSRLDETSDRERIPSQFFLRCAAAARGTPILLRELIPGHVPGFRSVSLDNPGPGKGQLAVDEGEIRLGLIARDPAGARAALALIAGAERERMAGPAAYDHARWERRLTEFDGRISDPTLRLKIEEKLQTGTSQLSASRIEEYAKCPYFFFLRRVHDLEKWEEEERSDSLDPLLRGQAIHAILEAFVREFRGKSFVSAPLPALQQALADCARQQLEENRPPALPDLLWEIERDRLLEMLRNWLDAEMLRADSNLHPVHLERPFGTFEGSTESPAYRVMAAGRPWEFRGRIDRVDLSPDGLRARIIDYKTGMLPQSMTPKKRTLLMAGEKIQLAIYRGALSQMEDLKHITSVEAEYLHLQPRDGAIAPCLFTDAELQEATARLPEMLAIIQEGIHKGVFFARTRGSVRPNGHCRYCDFVPICGKDRERKEADKSADPEVRRFARLQELDGISEEEE